MSNVALTFEFEFNEKIMKNTISRRCRLESKGCKNRLYWAISECRNGQLRWVTGFMLGETHREIYICIFAITKPQFSYSFTLHWVTIPSTLFTTQSSQITLCLLFVQRKNGEKIWYRLSFVRGERVTKCMEIFSTWKIWRAKEKKLNYDQNYMRFH